MTLSNVRKTLVGNWPRMVIFSALLAAFAGLLCFKLAALTGGYSQPEVQTVLDAASWRQIFDHPVNAPFLAAVHLLGYIIDNQLLAARVVAAACGLGTLIVFYAIVRYWHGERAAVFGTVLFGISAWFLHTARLGVPDVLLFGVLALVACFIWLKHTGNSLAVLAGFILIAALLYVPGMVWFIVIGAVLQWRSIDGYFKRNLWAVTAGSFILIAALVPLGFALYQDPNIAKVFAGLPADGWPLPLDTLKNLASVPMHLFIQTPSNPGRWLGDLAVIDYFTTALFFLGGYVYLRAIKLRRVWLVAAGVVMGAILYSLDGAISLTVIVPFIYIVAAAGIGFLLDQWLTVFPRNVFAKSVGYGLVGLAVTLTCIYSIRHYFFAWPAAPATKTIFTVKEPS